VFSGGGRGKGGGLGLELLTLGHRLLDQVTASDCLQAHAGFGDAHARDDAGITNGGDVAHVPRTVGGVLASAALGVLNTVVKFAIRAVLVDLSASNALRGGITPVSPEVSLGGLSEFRLNHTLYFPNVILALRKGRIPSFTRAVNRDENLVDRLAHGARPRVEATRRVETHGRVHLHTGCGHITGDVGEVRQTFGLCGRTTSKVDETVGFLPVVHQSGRVGELRGGALELRSTRTVNLDGRPESTPPGEAVGVVRGREVTSGRSRVRGQWDGRSKTVRELDLVVMDPRVGQPTGEPVFGARSSARNRHLCRIPRDEPSFRESARATTGTASPHIQDIGHAGNGGEAKITIEITIIMIILSLQRYFSLRVSR